MTEEEKKLILNVISSCNELLNGKFILADNKISKIISDISASTKVCEYIESCLNNFNYTREFAIAKVKAPTRAGYFVLPEKKSNIVALVFCILVDINNRSIDLSNLLRDYFGIEENGKVGYEKFAKQLIEPFKNIIAEQFELPNDVIVERKKEEKMEKEEVVKEEVEVKETKEEKIDLTDKNEKYAKDISRVAEEIITIIEKERKIPQELKEDTIYLMKALLSACEMKNIKFINALIVAFSYMSAKLRPVFFLARELKETMVDYYMN